MAYKYLLGIDIGTRSSKGTILDFEGNTVANGTLEHRISNPKQGWFEQDAEEIWWSDFIKLCRHMLSKANINPKRISAIGCSALAANFLPMGRENRPLRSAILYGIDRRSSLEIAELNMMIGEDKILKNSGNKLTAQSVGPKILWFKKNESDLYKKTQKVIPATTYLVYQLTGKYAIDHYGASTFEPLFNLKELKWDRELSQEVGISPDLLPDIHASFDVIGYVNESASKETGLAKGTPVIVGGPDSLMEMISVGSTKAGEAVLVYGSTMLILRIIKEPKIDSALILRPFLFRDRYIIVGAMATSGMLIDWFVKNFTQSGLNDANAYNLLIDKAHAISPGSEGLIVLPYFSGERTPIWDQRARGLILGLTLSHTKIHIYRAILEGIAYSLLHLIDRMKDTGFTIREVRAIGGGVRNSLWTQIISDVTGLSQDCVSKSADAHIGASYLAGYGVGVFHDFELLKNKWVKVEKRIKPDRKNWEIYQRYYQIYSTLYENTNKQMHDLSYIAESKTGE